tara:strand:+ start:5732 stop:7006 length:1275 start_codon:yes stop_codon:yes gene_type:complete
LERLNYFNPYSSKTERHEDRLTRSFLVLLKYSPSCYSFFYESIIENCPTDKLPSLRSQINDDIQFKTQVSSISFDTEKLLSILITNESYIPTQIIKPIERGATYDGVISIGKKMSIIIETKPDKNHVWENQLCPSSNHISEDLEIIEKPVVITWSSIINWLNEFCSCLRYQFTERQVANDFLNLINSQFSYLNPFDTYARCKGNTSLILKRTENLLKSIVNDEALVRNHQGWGYFIETLGFSSIRKIGLIYNENKGFLELSLYFGDTQGQAKSYYPTKVSSTEFKSNNWIVYGNFHLATVASNLVYFQSDKIEDYISYWNKNITTIKQIRNHKKLYNYLKLLYEKGIVSKNENDLKNKILNTNIVNVNICPGIGFIYRYSMSKAAELDLDFSLQIDLIKNIKYCIKENINSDCNFLKDINNLDR